jgi:folate-dependent tRNA-U54 methylase TrmFO/GidA
MLSVVKWKCCLNKHDRAESRFLETAVAQREENWENFWKSLMPSAKATLKNWEKISVILDVRKNLFLGGKVCRLSCTLEIL